MWETAQDPRLVYLDSNVYLDYLKGDGPHQDALKAVFDAWRVGAVEIATSALTLTEVLYVKLDDAEPRVTFDRTRESDIIDLFRQYDVRKFRLIELERTIAEGAREVVWDRGVHPKDAVHIASALRAHVTTLFTTDSKLLGLSGQVGGQPLLKIERPHWAVQTSLDVLPPPA